MEIVQKLKMEFRELLSLLTVEEIMTNYKLIRQTEKVQKLFVRMYRGAAHE
jgi:hypothetical protein